MPQPNLMRLAPFNDPLVEIPAEGREFNERNIDGLTREGRAASTKLRRDILGRKKAFTLSYELADQATVDLFDASFQENGELTLEVTHLTEVKTYIVLMQPFDKTRLLAVWGGMWSGLVVEFNEV